MFTERNEPRRFCLITRAPCAAVQQLNRRIARVSTSTIRASMPSSTSLPFLIISITHCDIVSGVSRISFRGGFKFFLEKWGYLMHGAKRRLLGGFGGMRPRENFLKWCNLVRFREYFAKILSKK